MISVYLHGPKGHLLGDKPFRCAVETIEQAINALCKQVKALTPIPGEEKIVYSVAGVVQLEDLRRIHTEENFEVHLVPAMVGGGGIGRALLMIGIGLLIIAVAWWNPLGWVVGGAMMMAAFGVGASMLLSGLLALIQAPTPDMNASQTGTSTGAVDPQSSRYLGQPKNTVKMGTRVNVAFGQNKIAGHFLSFNISSTNGVDTAETPIPTQTSPDVPNDGSAHSTPSARYPI